MQSPSPKNKEYKDDWGTAAREGYEDRGAFRAPRAQQKTAGSPFLRGIGAFCIVTGVLWATYLVTHNGALSSLSAVTQVLQQNHGPIAIAGLGIVASLLGKYLRL